MEISELLEALKRKPVLGEYGAFNRPFVILDVAEYHAVLDALRAKPERPTLKVPRETVRA